MNMKAKPKCHALGAEGVPCGGGYGEQYNDGMLDEAINPESFRGQLARLQAPLEHRAAEGVSREAPRTERQQAGLRHDRWHVSEHAPGRPQRHGPHPRRDPKNQSLQRRVGEESVKGFTENAPHAIVKLLHLS